MEKRIFAILLSLALPLNLCPPIHAAGGLTHNRLSSRKYLFAEQAVVGPALFQRHSWSARVTQVIDRTLVRVRNFGKRVPAVQDSEEIFPWLSETIRFQELWAKEIDKLSIRSFSFREQEATAVAMGTFWKAQREWLNELRRRTTDDGFALPSLLERAEDALMQGRSASIGVVTFPLVNSKKVGQLFGDSSFTDWYQHRLLEMMQAQGRTVAFNNGRLFVLGATAEEFHALFEEANRGAVQMWKSNAAFHEAIQKGKTEEELSAAIAQLPFYFAHTTVASSVLRVVEPSVYDSEFITGDAMEEARLRGDAPEIYARADHAQAWRQQEAAEALSNWLAEGRRSQQRAAASVHAERLTIDAYHRLLQGVETAEKGSPELISELRGASSRTHPTWSPNALLVDDATVAEFRKTTISLDKQKLLSELQKQFFDGQQKSIPLLNFDTGHLPRPGHVRALGRVDALNGLRFSYNQVLKAKGSDQTTNARLEEFKSAFIDYQDEFYYALVMSYRNPRLESVYKLSWIAEVAEADRRGDLAALKRLLMARAAEIGLQKPNLRDRLLHAADLIHPGVLVFGRDAGDENAIAKLEGNRYATGMTELNKANARRNKYGDDDRDSTFHRIKKVIVGVAESNRDRSVIEMLSRIQTRVVEMSRGEPFQPTEKIDVGFSRERMKIYHLVINSRPTSDRIAISSAGDVYLLKKGSPDRWVRLPASKIPKTWVPATTTLSVAALANVDLRNPDQLVLGFQRDEALQESYLKKVSAWSGSVVTDRELLNLAQKMALRANSMKLYQTLRHRLGWPVLLTALSLPGFSPTHSRTATLSAA